MDRFLRVWVNTKGGGDALSITDCRDGEGKLNWNYNDKVRGSFSAPADLVDYLMRRASRKMPYFERRSILKIFENE